MSEKLISEVRLVQLISLKVLVSFDRFCKEHKINYVLVAGTLLGAIRHGGFIPWDTDIDISVSREDYNRLIALAKNGEMPEHCLVDCDELNDKCFHNFMKLTHKSTHFSSQPFSTSNSHSGIFIDIFPLDKHDGNISRVEEVISNITRNLVRLKSYKNGKKNSIRKSQNTNFTNLILKFLSRIFSTRTYNYFVFKFYQRYNNLSVRYVTNYNSKYGIRRQLMRQEMYGKRSKVTFERFSFPAPSDTDHWLKNIYGSYNLPVQDRSSDQLLDGIYYDFGPYKKYLSKCEEEFIQEEIERKYED